MSSRRVLFYYLYQRVIPCLLELTCHHWYVWLYRTRVAGQFREGTGLTMFTSDVSARGVDYPDVTLVLQVCCYTLIQQALQRCCCIFSLLVMHHGWLKTLPGVVHSCALHSEVLALHAKLVWPKAAQWSQSLSKEQHRLGTGL